MATGKLQNFLSQDPTIVQLWQGQFGPFPKCMDDRKNVVFVWIYGGHYVTCDRPLEDRTVTMGAGNVVKFAPDRPVHHVQGKGSVVTIELKSTDTLADLQEKLDVAGRNLGGDYMFLPQHDRVLLKMNGRVLEVDHISVEELVKPQDILLMLPRCLFYSGNRLGSDDQARILEFFLTPRRKKSNYTVRLLMLFSHLIMQFDHARFFFTKSKKAILSRD